MIADSLDPRKGRARRRAADRRVDDINIGSVGAPPARGNVITSGGPGGGLLPSAGDAGPVPASGRPAAAAASAEGMINLGTIDGGGRGGGTICQGPWPDSG